MRPIHIYALKKFGGQFESFENGKCHSIKQIDDKLNID